MAVYVGVNANSLQLISSAVTKERVRAIVEAEFLPKVGAFKYLARRNPVSVNVSSSAFDGWVYADGTAYPRSDFPTASSVFGSRFGGDGSYFAVPNLQKFVRPTGGNSELETVQSSACVPDHYHMVNTKIKYQTDHVLKAAFTICQTGTSNHYVGDPSGTDGKLTLLNKDNYANYVNCVDPFANCVPGLHGGANSVTTEDHQVMVDLNVPAKVSFKVVGCGYAGTEHPDGYPAHKLLQVMVYIGRKGA